MPVQVLMPALSPTMTEGKLAKWAKMEVEAADEGILGRILVPEGTEGVAVNTPIALLLADGEDASALDASASPQMADKEPSMSPRGEPATTAAPKEAIAPPPEAEYTGPT